VRGNTRNLGDPYQCESNEKRECITALRLIGKSEEFIVAWKSGNSDGAKGFHQMDADSERGQDRLETTTILPETPLNQWGLSDGLAFLRTKLFHKAKAEPSFRFYSLFSLITRQDTLVNFLTYGSISSQWNSHLGKAVCGKSARTV